MKVTHHKVIRIEFEPGDTDYLLYGLLGDFGDLSVSIVDGALTLSEEVSDNDE